jgi:hypothetical protein
VKTLGKVMQEIVNCVSFASLITDLLNVFRAAQDKLSPFYRTVSRCARLEIRTVA